ncbi:MAG TPA: site-specific DNA-methyltransferase [Chthoniobacterales bacterium]|nr:site-specific DNA-methyltransferase [Chthoniobacterales bacterium]
MSDPTEKLGDLLPLSPDHNTERLAALKQLFPDLFTNEGGLNVDELKKVVDPKLVSETERYDFRWYGKTASKREAFTPSRAALVCDKARSVNPAKAGGNMIIEGENLEVLKLLTSSYRERVKFIYIDPPYNTGKDFVYSDRFAEGQRPYWEQTGVTEGGVKVDTNTDSDGRFHSNWLSMIHSRLLVARYLLRPDGLVFVSIDDTEVVNLRRVMDDVFGEECRLAQLVWKNKYNAGALTKGFSSVHEYILCYSRSEITNLTQPLNDEDIAQYKGRDAKFATRGGYVTQPLATSSKDPRPNLMYPITIGGREILPDKQWIWERTKVEAAIANDEVVVNETDGKVSVRVKQYLKDENGNLREKKPLSLFVGPFNQEGTKETDELLGDGIFTFPKPVALIKQLLSLTVNETKDTGGIHLDFFGGSGTTAQAVMELNKADGGNRQFVLVQLPELTAADSPAHQAGFKKISDITIKRNQLVITKIQKEAEALFPNDPQRQFADGLGFKVFKLAKSNFPRVEFAPDPDKTEAENIELLKQYIREKEATFHMQWERETVLDEVLLKNGFMLDYTLTPRPEFTKNEVFLAKDAHKESLICLDARIAPETVDHFKNHTEHFFICLELALDTTKKWNLRHHLGDKLKAF